ncbi:MAG: ABC transporter permease [Oscillospiraceae bacterium]|jgi:NitT/TauT family transport system permease protein|nr:ABC transporter permease [Oscillospiraceae bacterium]
MKKKAGPAWWRKAIVPAVWVAAFVLIWELAAFVLTQLLPPTLAIQKLPFLHNIAVTFVSNFFSLLESGWVTLSKSFVGFGIGAAVGFLLAVLMSWSKVMEKLAFPYLIISQMIPILGLAPIVYNIVRDGDVSRILISAYITFFPIAANTLSGLKSSGQDERDLMFAYAAKKPTVYRKLLLPSALPHLFTGLKIAAPMSVTAAIVVELLGTSSGIGVKILYTLYYGANGALMFWSSILMAALLGITSYYIVFWAERLCIPWAVAARKKAG